MIIMTEKPQEELTWENSALPRGLYVTGTVDGQGCIGNVAPEGCHSMDLVSRENGKEFPETNSTEGDKKSIA